MREIFFAALFLFYGNLSAQPMRTIDEKIGQLFYFFFYGDEFNEQAEKLISRYHAGNFIYYAWSNDLVSKEKVKRLSNAIQKACIQKNGIPALIGIDQEGGDVSRLRGEFSYFPAPSSLRERRDLAFIKKVGREMGREIKEVGINLNFAPVVDIASDASSFIYKRSFGKNPEEVIANASAFIEGLKESGVYSTIKHFPGHGAKNDSTNSHLGLPIVDLTLDELENWDLKPFCALAEKSHAIMAGHLLFPKIDSKRPASSSPFFLQSLLREKMGYRGLIISDSIMMRACAPCQDSFEEMVESVSEAAIQCFIAGCDQLILGRPEWGSFNNAKDEISMKMIEGVLDRFKKAFEEKRISEERLNQSLDRILNFKKTSFT